jgi:hypothetical protein
MLNHTLYTCNCSARGHDIPYCWQVQIMNYKDNITVKVLLPFETLSLYNNKKIIGVNIDGITISIRFSKYPRSN